MKLTRMLVKMGLAVDSNPEPTQTATSTEPPLSLDDINAQLSQMGVATQPTAPTPVVDVESDIPEGVEFQTIFESANIPGSPFPYEKFAKLLDGLTALSEDARKAAVAAMDSADDTWTVQDIAQDTVAKRQALEQYQQDLKATITSMDQHTQETIASTQKASDERVHALRAQIQELETQIQQEVVSSTEAQSTLRQRLETNRRAAEREHFRVDSSIQNMRRVERTFFPSDTVSNAPAVSPTPSSTQ